MCQAPALTVGIVNVSLLKAIPKQFPVGLTHEFCPKALYRFLKAPIPTQPSCGAEIFRICLLDPGEGGFI